MNHKLKIPKVKNFFCKKVVVLHPEDTALDAINCLNKNDISSAPVVNDQGAVVGFLSECDLIKSLGNNLFYEDAPYLTVEKLMENNVKMVNGEWDIFELESFFTTNHLKMAPVTDVDNKIIGVVSRRDLLKQFELIVLSRIEYKRVANVPTELSTQDAIVTMLELR